MNDCRFEKMSGVLLEFARWPARSAIFSGQESDDGKGPSLGRSAARRTPLNQYYGRSTFTGILETVYVNI